MAAVDYFLKLDGIQGESRDARHAGEIELESFSWGETATAAPAGGGAGAGKVHVEELHVVMRTSKASPQLLLACASGRHGKQAVLTARQAGAGQLEFLVFTLTDVLVSSYRIGGSVDGMPTEQVSLAFARIEVAYHAQKADGSPDAAIRAGWDVKANKKT